MLIPYKQLNKKIAMGLLSFMPKEKDVKRLQKTIDQYDENPDWKLYFWQENGDFIGIIGVAIQGDKAMLQHLCVNPSYRQEGIGKKMLHELAVQLSIPLKPTKETKGFFQSCLEETL